MGGFSAACGPSRACSGPSPPRWDRERQGRVFGFAQLIENAASPITAFLMAPLGESIFMPFMTDGAGTDLIGGWFGTGPDRGLGLMFTLAGLVGVIVTVFARRSRTFARLETTTAATREPVGSDSAQSCPVDLALEPAA